LKTLQRKLGKVFETLPVEAIPAGWLYDEYGNLNYEGATLSVGLYCCHLANTHKSDGVFTLDRGKAEEYTGYNRRTIQRALVELMAVNTKCERTLILCMHTGDSLPSTYSISTTLGYALKSFGGDKPETLRTLLFNAGLGYDDIPTYIMANLRAFKGEPLAAALIGLRQAQAYNSTVYTAVLKEWKEQSGINKDEALRNAWNLEAFKNLLLVKHTSRRRTAEVTLYDPIKHTELKYVKSDAIARAREREAQSQYDEEQKKSLRMFTPSELADWFLHEFPNSEFRDGEYYTDCPMCHGTEGGKKAPKPTVRSNFSKGYVGVFTCREHTKGRDGRCSFTGQGQVPFHLVALRDNISPADARQRMEEYILGRRVSQ